MGNNLFTSSYRWVRARRSSSVMSGRSTAMVSYCLRPGGHCGSSFSSRAAAAAADEPEIPPPLAPPPVSSSSLLPLSKKEPEKSSVMERTERAVRKGRQAEREGKRWNLRRVGEGETVSGAERGVEAIWMEIERKWDG